MQQLPKNIIMTPHPKEFDRLAGNASSSCTERLMKASELAELLQAYIILKGHYSALCHRDGKINFCSTGNSGMATAGSGDVLTGIITGLLATIAWSVGSSIRYVRIGRCSDGGIRMLPRCV